MSRFVFDEETIKYARLKGIGSDDIAFYTDGCSGGLSFIYNIMGRVISCEQCCHRHDIDYTMGGTSEERLAADKRLRECAANSGNFPDGFIGYTRRVWRNARAWAMYAAVRVWGNSRWTN